MAFTHGYALLVGVNENSVPGWALPDVAKDITALEAVLTHSERCAYLPENVRVFTGQSATKNNIMAGLAWLKEKLASDSNKNTTALIYFSGHGWQDNSLPQPAYYLIPFDVSGEKLRQTALRADDFAAEIAGFSPRRLLVLLDCCHAGGMGVKDVEMENLIQFTIPPAWLMGGQSSINLEAGEKDINTALLSQGSGRAVLNSSRGTERSYIRKDRKMSIFTYHLIEALTGYTPHRDEDKEVTVADVLGYVWRTVPQSAIGDWQQPQHPDGQLSGNFPIALLLGGEGASAGKSLPDPLSELPSERTPNSHPVFNLSGQVVNGPQTNIDGDVNGSVLSGNFEGKVNIDQRQVKTGGGDYVEGDKIDSSIHIGKISGNKVRVAIGQNANVANYQPSAFDDENFAGIFAELLNRVDKLSDEAKKKDAGNALKIIEGEARKGENTNERQTLRWLKFLASISKDIFEVAVDAFTSPVSGFSTAFRKIAQRAKEEQNGE